MSFQFIITDAGRAALVAAGNTGTNAVQITQVGLTQSVFTPSAALTALPGEFARLTTFGAAAVAPDTIHLTVRDEGAGAYDLHGFGLYLSNGTLFGVYGSATSVVQKAELSIMLLALDIVLAAPDVAAITFGPTGFIDPPATETVAGVISLATAAEAVAGAAPSKAITPATLKPLLDVRVRAVNPDGNPHAIALGWSGTRFRADVDNGNVSKDLATTDDVAALQTSINGKVGGVYPGGTPHAIALGWSGTRFRADVDNGNVSKDLATTEDVAALQTSINGKVGSVYPGGTPHVIAVGWSGTRFRADVDNGNVSKDLATTEDVAALQTAVGGKQASLGFTPVQQGTGAGQLANTIKVGWSGTRLKAQVDNLDLGNVVLDSQMNAAISAAISGLINGAPGSLDALNELAAALGNDPNFATTIANALAGKVGNVYPGGTPHVIAVGWSGTRFRADVDNGNVSKDLATTEDVAELQTSINGKVTVSNPDGNPHTLTLGWTGSRLRTHLDGALDIDLTSLSDFAGSIASPGYCRLPNGLIVQWFRNFHGWTDTNGECVLDVVFPIAFPNAVLGLSFCHTDEAAANPPVQNIQLLTRQPSLTSIPVMVRATGVVEVAASGVVVGW